MARMVPMGAPSPSDAPACGRYPPVAVDTTFDLDQPVIQLMTAMQTAVGAEQTIGEAIESLRQRAASITGVLLYAYVVDDADRLVGYLSVRRMLLSRPDARCSEVMLRQTVSVRFDAPLREAFEIFARQRLLALPVVDDEGRLLGTIGIQTYTEGAAELAEQKQAEEIFQRIGVSVEQARMGGSLRGFALRMPWLSCNIVGGLGCALIASLFEETTVSVVALVFFLPLVLTLGEAVAIQAHTIAMPLVEQSPRAWQPFVRRLRVEFSSAALLGIACGSIAAAAALCFGPQHQRRMMALIVLCSCVFGMVASAMAGTLVPLGLRILRLDPKLAAGPVALVVADVMNTLGYLGLAAIFLEASLNPSDS